MSDSTRVKVFLGLSAELTGFSEFDLQGTGETASYLDAAIAAVGEPVLDDLLSAHSAVDGSPEERTTQLRQQILGDPKLGPVARNIIKMWFSGVWNQLPAAWVSRYGIASQPNASYAVRPSSYAEGLLWKTIGANPPGARAPGYGSWAEPPRIPDPDQALSLLASVKAATHSAQD